MSETPDDVMKRAFDAWDAMRHAEGGVKQREIIARAIMAERNLSSNQVEWVVNDLAELGVKIKDQFFWLYKGRSLVYSSPNEDNDPPKPIMWRYVHKREFGECCHPINYSDPTMVGTVDVNDGEAWKAVPGTEVPHDQA